MVEKSISGSEQEAEIFEKIQLWFDLFKIRYLAGILRKIRIYVTIIIFVRVMDLFEKIYIYGLVCLNFWVPYFYTDSSI